MIQKNYFSKILIINVMIFICFSKAQAQNLDKLHSSIEELKDSLKLPGLSYAVVQDEETILMNSLGYADVDEKIEETNQTKHFIASTTKTITGIGLMKLVETGKIKLDDPISLYLDDVHASWKKITIRQAASHTSGLPNILNENGDPIGGGTIEQSWDIVKQKPLVRESGKKWEYNQAGLEVIQRIYKNLSNQSWESHINETVVEPADMSNTTWLWDQHQKSPNLSVVYELTKESKVEEYGIIDNFDYYLPAGTGIFTSIKDMTSFAKALQAEKLISNTLLTEMWTTSDFENSDYQWLQAYGIGWIIDEYADQKRVWHSGGGKACFMHYPDKDLSIIVLSNLADGGIIPFTTLLSDYFFR